MVRRLLVNQKERKTDMCKAFEKAAGLILD